MNVIAIVSSLFIIVGCFLPWLQLGALFANRGIDNTDGAIILVASIISGAVAIYNQQNKVQKNSWVFTVVGILGLLIAFYDLNEVHTRADKLAKSMAELSDLLGENKNLPLSNFIGSGLYIVFAGSIGLLISRLRVFNATQNELEIIKASQIPGTPLEIVAPKYSKVEEKIKTPEESENEAYRNNLIMLNQLILAQKKKIFGRSMTKEIKDYLSVLVQTKQAGIHLLNSYHTLFNKTLIEDLIKLNSTPYDYDIIRQNVSQFVDLGIVNNKFPHERK